MEQIKVRFTYKNDDNTITTVQNHDNVISYFSSNPNLLAFEKNVLQLATERLITDSFHNPSLISSTIHIQKLNTDIHKKANPL